MEEHTFVILAYKQSPYLEDCIRSLQSQTAASSIVMATSTPSAWLAELASRFGIPLLVRDGESGIAADWNFGLSAGDAKLVTLAHQDDLYDREYAGRIIASARTHADALILFTNNALLIDGKRVDRTLNLRIQRLLLWPYRINKAIRSRWVRRMTLAFGNPVCCPSVTYNRQNIGSFAFDPSYPNNLDWEAWLRLAQARGAFVYERDILMTHRLHRHSETSSSLARKTRHRDDRRIFSKIWPWPLAAVISGLYALAYRSRHE